jgi:hypothetical protein
MARRIPIRMRAPRMPPTIAAMFVFGLEEVEEVFGEEEDGLVGEEAEAEVTVWRPGPVYVIVVEARVRVYLWQRLVCWFESNRIDLRG